MKRFLYFILLLTLLSGAVFLIWQKVLNRENVNSDLTKSSAQNKSKDIIPEPVIPKVNSYEVPILMYHYIRIADPEDTMGIKLSVTPENFETQIRWLSENDFLSVKLADLADPDLKAISKVIYQKKKPIILSFDDGYEDAYTNALPVLQKYNFNGTFFIIRNFVGRNEYMDQAQIDQMVKVGMEIGSHTLSHLNLANLDTDNAKKQISDSKENAQIFCYPAGKYTENTVAIVKDAGYLAAVTTHGGISNQDSNLFELPRVRIENISIESFKNKFSQ